MRYKETVKKYRPVLSAAQIEHILNLCRFDIIHAAQLPDGDIETSSSIISVLSPFQAKIENAGISPAYTTTPKPSMLEQLGAVPITPTTRDNETYWHKCYIKMQESPNLCTLQEIAAAKEHMYLNDLMSEEEVEAFERGMR
jgi:hypothetical protein